MSGKVSTQKYVGLQAFCKLHKRPANLHSAFTRRRLLVRSQHRPLVKASFCRENAIAWRGSALTPGLFYTSPITAVPTSADAAPAPGPGAGRGPCGTAASGWGA